MERETKRKMVERRKRGIAPVCEMERDDSRERIIVSLKTPVLDYSVKHVSVRPSPLSSPSVYPFFTRVPHSCASSDPPPPPLLSYSTVPVGGGYELAEANVDHHPCDHSEKYPVGDRSDDVHEDEVTKDGGHGLTDATEEGPEEPFHAAPRRVVHRDSHADAGEACAMTDRGRGIYGERGSSERQ